MSQHRATNAKRCGTRGLKTSDRFGLGVAYMRLSPHILMGITKTTVTLLGPTKRTNVELVVDTGSILTWVRSDRLRGLGFKPRREKDFHTIEGRILRRKTGPATLRCDGRRRTLRQSLAGIRTRRCWVLPHWRAWVSRSILSRRNFGVQAS